MTVRIKELIIRYEDDGEMSAMSAAEQREKYNPLKLVVHHHCAPPPNNPGALQADSPSEAKEFRIDLSTLDQK